MHLSKSTTEPNHPKRLVRPARATQRRRLSLIANPQIVCKCILAVRKEKKHQTLEITLPSILRPRPAKKYRPDTPKSSRNLKA